MYKITLYVKYTVVSCVVVINDGNDDIERTIKGQNMLSKVVCFLTLVIFLSMNCN